MWIRDGVLIDRMHINPVAFAFASFLYIPPELREGTDLETLINFGFEKSGFSCADKMIMYNRQRRDILHPVHEAAGYYNVLASEAASSCQCFPGTVDLLRDLSQSGVRNYITSAVEQYVLDAWAQTPQGLLIMPYMEEILGRRYNLSKGKDHFQHVAQELRGGTIYYVADAVAEIQAAQKYVFDYNISAIGFGHVIGAGRVAQALELVKQAYDRLGADSVPYPLLAGNLEIDMERLELADESKMVPALREAGAQYVVSGNTSEIMPSLRRYFTECSVLPEKEGAHRTAGVDIP